MKKAYSFYRVCFAFLFIITLQVGALTQVQDPLLEDHSYKPLQLKLSEDGKKYVRFIMWHQLWLTTNNLSGDAAKLQITPSIRRSRFLAFSQVSSKFLILTHFGLNSLTPGNLTSLGSNGDAPQFFLHGAWGELKISDKLYIGSGLHYWKGLTRLANQSTLNFMTLDQARPFSQWHSLGITDQFARHLGIYAKGQMGGFDYRFAINAPGQNPLNGGENYGMEDSSLSYTGAIAMDENNDPTGMYILEGYFRYNFWDKESTKLPYQVGTYLGKKKVFGIGTGFFLHPNGMYNESTGEHSGVTHLAVDAFLEYPTANGNMLHAYASLINFDYGENYVSRWAGTGTNVYGQFGYFIKHAKSMPYIAFQNGSYDGYDDPIQSLDVGINHYINGHHCKVTLEYHRIMGDVREAQIATQDDALTQLRLQLHVFL
ncbi:MAG: porin [Bacteroidota bacterium]